jgi:hypothetical protein
MKIGVGFMAENKGHINFDFSFIFRKGLPASSR